MSLLNRKPNIVDVGLGIMREKGEYCDRGCVTDWVGVCVGTSPINRCVVLVNPNFLVNTQRSPSDVIPNLPKDCPFFKREG